MEYRFDKAEIEKQCDGFFTMYNVTKGHIHDMCERKKVHTHAVAQNSHLIAQSLGLSPYDQDMAWVIGELHDFARFGQAVVTKTFRDSRRFDHARMAVRLLFTHKMIEDIIPDYYEICPEDRHIMELAILHHSDLRLPEDLTDREKLFCDIIREADCIDIFRVVYKTDWETIYGCDRRTLFSSDITEEILTYFERNESVDRKKCRTPGDFYLGHIALCFCLKSKAALKLAVEMGYLSSLLDASFSSRIAQERFKRAVAQVEKYALA